jgi:hypothetical protein
MIVALHRKTAFGENTESCLKIPFEAMRNGNRAFHGGFFFVDSPGRLDRKDGKR